MKSVFLFFFLIFYSNFLNALEFKGKFEQGSFIIGKTQKGSVVKIDNQNIRLTKEGYFVFGLDRDRKNDVIIKILRNNNTKIIEWKKSWAKVV